MSSNKEIDLDAALARYKDGFGGGMVAFDNAYHAALRDGATVADAQMRGAHALLDSFVAVVKAGDDVRWLDRRGMPVNPSSATDEANHA